MLQHINGNSLYDYRDPAFRELVAYTAKFYPAEIEGNSYDVALWKVVADFPYAWPFWQRYASKFQHTDMVSGRDCPRECTEGLVGILFCAPDRFANVCGLRL